MQNKKTMSKFVRGITLVEVMVVISIIALLVVIVTTSFNSFNKNRSLQKDTENIITILRQARNQTLTSKNSSTYGVYFASSTVTLFAGSLYNQNSVTNEVTYLSPDNVISNLSLGNGVNSVVFRKLTGEANQYGTVTVTSSDTSDIKIVTIYKTGLVESQ